MKCLELTSLILKISLSVFQRLRPKYLLLASVLSRSPCLARNIKYGTETKRFENVPSPNEKKITINPDVFVKRFPEEASIEICFPKIEQGDDIKKEKS